MKYNEITEDRVSAALHTANAKHAACIEKLFELLKYHKNVAAEEGTSVNGIELAEDLEAFIEEERWNKSK